MSAAGNPVALIAALAQQERRSGQVGAAGEVLALTALSLAFEAEVAALGVPYVGAGFGAVPVGMDGGNWREFLPEGVPAP